MTAESGMLPGGGEARRIAAARRWAATAAGATAAGGLVVLTGWAASVSRITSVLEGAVPMMPFTAVAFCLSGAALWFAQRDARGRIERQASALLAVLVVLIGALTLAEYIGRLPLEFDRWLFSDAVAARAAAGLAPGRMAPTTAVNFVALGLSLLLLDVRPADRLRAVLMGGVVVSSMFSLTGYLYGIEGFYRLGALTPMAVHTAASFLVIVSGLLCARPQRGLMAFLASDSDAGHAARRLLPLAVVLPPLVGWLRLAGQRAGWYGTEAGLGLMTLMASALAVATAWLVLHPLQAAQALRRQQRQALQATTARLEEAEAVAGLGSWEYRIGDAGSWRSSGLFRLFDLDPVRDGADPGAILARVHPEERAAIVAATEVAGPESRRIVEFRSDPARGPIRYFTASFSCSRDDASGRLRLFGTVQDVSHLREREALRRRWEAIFENALWGMVIIEPERSTIEYVNDAFARMHGYTVEEMIGVPVGDILAPESLDALPDMIRTATERGHHTYESLHRRKDGSRFHCLYDVTVVKDASGNVLFRAGHCLDITERKAADARIREQAALLDHARDAIVVRDLDHRITYWNKGAERLYGWTAEEATGRSVLDLHLEDADVFEQAHQATLQDGSWSGELTRAARDGRHIVVDCRWSLIRDEAGAPRQILAIGTDVTARKQLEERILRAHRLENIGALAGGIAHDLNNVLAPIAMATELLRETVTDADGRDLLNTVAVSARRGAELVKQILSFARGVEGQRVPVQVGHIIKEVQKIARSTFPKDIEVRIDFPSDLWVVDANPTQLQQVLLNLCVNARDAMPNGGVLDIEAGNVAGSEPAIAVTVRDTGTGIPSEVIGRIFDPFFTTKELGKGTGLGLSTSLDIVRQHGGELTVDSTPGAGATFRVLLPARPGPLAGADARGLHDLPRGDGDLILVVDDEGAIRQITRQTLEAFGYRVLQAGNGAEAIGLFARHETQVAAVLLDLGMPVMDGLETIYALQRINPLTPIIVTSGSSDATVERAVGAGVKHVIYKPSTAETLLTTLRKALDERA